MRAQYSTELLFAGAALLLVYGVGSTARADDAPPADPFSAVQAIDLGDLDVLRGGDNDVLESYNKITTVEATNNSENSIGTMTIDTRGGDGGTTGGAGGSVYGGNVSFNDNALQNFGGVYTSAINTAPGGIATALTSMTITLAP